MIQNIVDRSGDVYVYIDRDDENLYSVTTVHSGAGVVGYDVYNFTPRKNASNATTFDFSDLSNSPMMMNLKNLSLHIRKFFK